MTRLESTIEQICTARRYTLQLIEHVDPSDWFQMPREGVTHVAWQMGHLAVAEFGLSGRCIEAAEIELPRSFGSCLAKGPFPIRMPANTPARQRSGRSANGCISRRSPVWNSFPMRS